jgi:iron(III)-enterobactin esterase
MPLSQHTPPALAAHTRIHIPAFRSPLLALGRAVDLLLPPDDPRHPQQLSLLILNDGQDLDALRLPETLAALSAARQITPLAIAAVHATSDRLHEYGTAGIANADGLGSRADAYSALVCGELLPYLARHLPLRGGPTHTVVAGCSLGGLMAFDLAWRNPELFGAVGVFSGSFWWRTDNSSARAKVVSRIAHRRVRTAPGLPHVRFWLQAGTADEESDRDGDGVIDAIQDTRELIDALAERGYRPGRDLVYREVQGGRHDQATWAAVMPEFLRWAFPP